MFEEGMKVTRVIGFVLIALAFITSTAFAADGWAEGVTGGAGGTTHIVLTASAFKSEVESSSTSIVEVLGTIDLASVGGSVSIKSNKTIRGADPNATIIGDLAFSSGASNVIIEELNITNPTDYGEGDGITVKYADDVFISKCTVYECNDGCIDITRESNAVTVSWCKFYYVSLPSHRFVNLIGGGDSHPDEGKLNCTFHHNWWATLCHERMPRVRFGKVHVYNNYYSCSGNGYCIGVGDNSKIRVEDNYFDSVNQLWKRYDDPCNPGSIGWNSTNVYAGSSTEPTWATNDYPVFTPPYSYTLDAGTSVKSIVMAGAGNVGPPAAPTGLTPAPGDETITLIWDDNVENDLDGYNIYRSTTSGPPYGSPLNSSLLSDSNYVDNDVNNGTTYYYVVTAVDMAGRESDYSDEEWATPSDMTPPAPPVGLYALASEEKISLDWDNNLEPDMNGYNVYRSMTPGTDYNQINTSLVLASDYDDTTAVKGITYYYVVTAVDNYSNESDFSDEVAARIGDGGLGTILRESWTGIPGAFVSQLAIDPNYPDNPSGRDHLLALEGPTNWTDSYGTRIRGYLYPPADGNYTFWIAADDRGGVWLSTDGNPDNASVIAEVPGPTDPYEWDKYSPQESNSIYLSGGQKYYIEVLHKEDVNDDHIAVAWEGPGITQQVITGDYLSPWFIGLYGDSTGDDVVDANDLADFIVMWQKDDCLATAKWDLNGDCMVNFYEYSMLAANWLEEDPNAP